MGVVLVVQFLGNKTILSFDLSWDSDPRLLGTQPFLCSQFAVSVATGLQFYTASVTRGLKSEGAALRFRAQPLPRVLADAGEVQNLAQSLTRQIITSPPLSANEGGE